MKISLNWLREYVDFNLSIDEIVHQLTMAGLEVEAVHQLKPTFHGIVAGDVISKEKHPNADKLSVCRVNVGSETLQIVCGAPNVAAGQRVPIAMIGAELKGNFKIKPVKLRGIESHGMICSERELDLSESHDGIMVLDPQKFELGVDVANKLVPEDTVIEVNVTPNRPDCLSHIGVARELAAISNSKLKKPIIRIQESQNSIGDFISVKINDETACPRYVGRLIQNVQIAPSPEWMKNRLEAVGVRSINNIVDITNYVLMETGQPLHAFDYDKLDSQEIIIRKAKEGETFQTLDNKEHTLKTDDLLICDGPKGVALAGIMGGANSEISDQTVNIFLESAYFDPMTIRKSAKRLGMSTEASQRFERGADPENTIYAADRAAQLFCELANGSLAKNVADVYPKVINKKSVSLRFSSIPKILGISIDKEKIVEMLSSIELEVQDGDPIQVVIPTNRPDLTREIDLIEEVVRLYGYDNITPKTETTFTLQSEIDEELQFTEKLKDLMVGLGYREIWTASFTSKKNLDILAPNLNAVNVKNPLSPDTAYIRTTLATGVLESVKWNFNRGSKNLQLFEIGKQFIANDSSLPTESTILMGALAGNVHYKNHWREKSRSMDFYDIKGNVEALFAKLHIQEYNWIKDPVYLLNSQSSLSIVVNNNKIGWAGEVSDKISDSFGLEKGIFLFQLDLHLLFRCLPGRTKYQTIAKYPIVKRDLAILVDEDILVQDLQSIITEKSGSLLINTEVFDFYHGEQIPSGKKSIAFSLSFQSNERTLTENEIEPIIQSVMKALESKYSATLR